MLESFGELMKSHCIHSVSFGLFWRGRRVSAFRQEARALAAANCFRTLLKLARLRSATNAPTIFDDNDKMCR
jgi:hypothetical protein